MSRRLPALILALIVLVSLTGIPQASDAQSKQRPPKGIPRSARMATVRAIVDGDTIRVTREDGTKATVRLIGIEAPATKDRNSPAECFGPEAADRLAELLPVGREIWLERDQTNRDRADRLLRYVWVHKHGGGVFLVNEVMVRDGSAIAKRNPPDTKRAKRLERAQARAIVADLGMWSSCVGIGTAVGPDNEEPSTPTPESPPTRTP